MIVFFSSKPSHFGAPNFEAEMSGVTYGNGSKMVIHPMAWESKSMDSSHPRTSRIPADSHAIFQWSFPNGATPSYLKNRIVMDPWKKPSSYWGSNFSRPTFLDSTPGSPAHNVAAGRQALSEVDTGKAKINEAQIFSCDLPSFFYFLYGNLKGAPGEEDFFVDIYGWLYDGYNKWL